MPRRSPLPDASHAARLLQGGNLAEAERLARQLVKRNKRDAQALQVLGTAALERGEYAEAADVFRRCIRIRPGFAGFHFLLGRALTMLGRYDQALESFDRVLRERPDDPLASGWKAAVHERRGDYDAAREVLRPFVDAGTESADMAELIARLDQHQKRYEDAVAIATRHLQRPDVTPGQRSLLQFAAGKALERLGEYDRSFEAFREANALAPHAPFDPRAHVQLVDELIEEFGADRLARLPRAADRSEVPVFIAGMPRSGTTLIEQIVDAHPEAHGAGEIEDVEKLAQGLQHRLHAYDPYPACMSDLTQAEVDRMSREYLASLGRLARGARRILNKSLENYLHLGLISRVCPGARVIHCRRHPMDTCLSCFMGGILPGRAPWVTDLEHLGLVYRQYERIMDHWVEVLDLPVLEIQYEQVVDDVEGAARCVLEFLDLPWDERCLRYYESGRAVLTLSYAQVNRPIYRSAVARYQRYEKHLEPLRRVLES